MNINELVKLPKFKKAYNGFESSEDVMISAANIDDVLIASKSIGINELEIEGWQMGILVRCYANHLPLSEKRADIIAEGKIKKYLGVNVEFIWK